MSTPEAMVVLGFATLGYFIPGSVAIGRGHPDSAAILALNALLGWTGLGWVGAFVWSLTVIESPAPESGLRSTASGRALVGIAAWIALIAATLGLLAVFGWVTR